MHAHRDPKLLTHNPIGSPHTYPKYIATRVHVVSFEHIAQSNRHTVRERAPDSAVLDHERRFSLGIVVVVEPQVQIFSGGLAAELGPNVPCIWRRS